MEPAEGCRMEDLRVLEHPGMHRYAPPRGLPDLLSAVAERSRARTGVETARDHVLITAGATGALGAAVGTIVAGVVMARQRRLRERDLQMAAADR